MRGVSFVVVGGSVQTLLRLGSEAAVQEQAAMPRCGTTAMVLMRLWAAMRGASFVVVGGWACLQHKGLASRPDPRRRASVCIVAVAVLLIISIKNLVLFYYFVLYMWYLLLLG